MINKYCLEQISQFPCSLDIGCSISIFPDILGNGNILPITWYNPTTNSPIRLTGNIPRVIRIGQNYYTWTFFTADIDYIILGADFIGSHFL